MTIYVIDDHPLMREGLEMIYRRIQVEQEVISLERLGLVWAAIEKYGKPTFFGLDLKLPDTTGVSGIRQLKKEYPSVPLALFTASRAGDWETHCYEAGADIFIEKASGSTEIYASIRGLFMADNSFEEPIPGQILSKRQIQLLKFWIKGMTNQEISKKINMDVNTLKVHSWRLLRLMEARNRTQAINNAKQQGLLR